MSLQSFLFRFGASRSDKKRDAAIPIPQGVTQCRDLSYGSYGDENLLDVYYPEGTAASLPTIVSIHGGGYTYGNKEIYLRYCMDLARRGFAVVNFNYRLAPKWKFPAPLEDTNAVLSWMVKNAERFHLDPQRVILIGDSAGAQLTSQYAAMLANPEYASHFIMDLPPITIRAVGLFCGMYDLKARASEKRSGLHGDYLGKALPLDDPRFNVLASIGENYPPAFIATSYEDFLHDMAQPMADFLTAKGIPNVCKCYGKAGDKKVGHVFHVNIALPEATQCNDDATAFWRQYV